MGTVDEYLASVEDDDDRAALARVYEIAREIAPDAEQGTGYGMPALKLHGKVLISAIRAARHVGIYPFSAGAIAAVSAMVDGVAGASTSTGTIRFAPGAAIPDDLIRALVLFRVDEIGGD